MDRYKAGVLRHRLAGEPWLFLTRSGKLSTNAVPDILARRCCAAGLEPCGPHKLRHSWADDENVGHVGLRYQRVGWLVV